MYTNHVRCPDASVHIPLGYNFETVNLTTGVKICRDVGMVIATVDTTNLNPIVAHCTYDMIFHYTHAITFQDSSDLPSIHSYRSGKPGRFDRYGGFYAGEARTARVICAGEFCSLKRNFREILNSM